jgi:hypothetical protein
MAFNINKNKENQQSQNSTLYKYNQVSNSSTSETSASLSEPLIQAFQDFPNLQVKAFSNENSHQNEKENYINVRKVPITIILEENKQESHTKRGRKLKSLSKDKTSIPNFIIEGKAKHSKYSHDNILRKIKVWFQRFLIHFSNQLILNIYGMQKFKIRKLNGMITQNVTLSFNRELINKTIAEILSNNTSVKYNSVLHEQNKKNIFKLSSKPIFNQFFKMTYKEVYQKLFIENDISMFDEQYQQYMSNLYNIHYFYKYMQSYYEPNYCIKILQTAKNFISYFENGANKHNSNKFKCEQN